MLSTKESSLLRQCAGVLKVGRYAHAAAKEGASAHSVLRAHKPVLSRLPNGVVVASCENYAPVSRISVAVRGGARYEPSNFVGASHFLRRIIGLVGTKNFTAFGLARSIQQMGASITSTSTREHLFVTAEAIRDFAPDAAERLANATTRMQFDRHWEIEEALKYVEADLVGYEQNLEARLLDALHDAAYRSTLRRSMFAAPYRVHENFEAHEFVEAFHSRAFGAPSGVALVALGVNHEDAEAFASKLHFGDSGHHQKGKDAAHTAVKKEASKFGGGERRVDTGDELTHAALVCESAGYSDLRSALAFGVLSKAVGGSYTVQRASNTATNRLGAALARAGLREPHFISSLKMLHSDTGLFGIYVVAHANEIGKAVRAGRAEFLQTLKNGVSAEDLKRGKQQLLAELAVNAECSDWWLARCASRVLETGQLPPNGEQVAAEIERLSLEDVNAAARRAAGGKPAYAVVGGLEHAPTLDEL